MTLTPATHMQYQTHSIVRQHLARFGATRHHQIKSLDIETARLMPEHSRSGGKVLHLGMARSLDLRPPINLRRTLCKWPTRYHNRNPNVTLDKVVRRGGRPRPAVQF